MKCHVTKLTPMTFCRMSSYFMLPQTRAMMCHEATEITNKFAFSSHMNRLVYFQIISTLVSFATESAFISYTAMSLLYMFSQNMSSVRLPAYCTHYRRQIMFLRFIGKARVKVASMCPEAANFGKFLITVIAMVIISGRHGFMGCFLVFPERSHSGEIFLTIHTLRREFFSWMHNTIMIVQRMSKMKFLITLVTFKCFLRCNRFIRCNIWSIC